MSCKKTLPIWNVWCENESCKKENSQSSSLRPIQWHELRVMFFSLPCGAAQQHLHLRCELRSIHCQYMPLLLWTASFAPVPEICINHWICVDNLTRRSIHIVFAPLHRTVCFPWSEDSSCTGCTIPLKWNQSFDGLSHSSTIFWRFLTFFLATTPPHLKVSVFFSSAQCVNWCIACGNVAGVVAQRCWDVAGTTEVMGLA